MEDTEPKLKMKRADGGPWTLIHLGHIMITLMLCVAMVSVLVELRQLKVELKDSVEQNRRMKVNQASNADKVSTNASPFYRYSKIQLRVVLRN